MVYGPKPLQITDLIKILKF